MLIIVSFFSCLFYTILHWRETEKVLLAVYQTYSKTIRYLQVISWFAVLFVNLFVENATGNLDCFFYVHTWFYFCKLKKKVGVLIFSQWGEIILMVGSLLFCFVFPRNLTNINFRYLFIFLLTNLQQTKSVLEKCSKLIITYAYCCRLQCCLSLITCFVWFV